MTKIGIIAGDGNLPLYIGKSLLSKNYDVTFLSLNNKNNKYYNNHDVIDLDILSVKKIFKVLDSNKIKHIIFAHNVDKVDGSKIFFKYFLNSTMILNLC